MTRITEMHKRWMDEPKYRKAYSALEDEFAVAKAVIAARNRTGQPARKVGATQPAVARNTFMRVVVRLLLFALATAALYGQVPKKAPGAGEVVVHTAGKAPSSASIRDLVSELRRTHTDSDADWEVHPTVSRNLDLLKHRLRNMIIRTLAMPDAAAMEPSSLAAQVIDQLAKEDVPVGDSGGYGVISRIEFHRPAEFPSWLIATTSLSIPYGDDTSLYLFELKDGSWKHVLTQESNGYRNIGEAQGGLTYEVAPASSG